MSIAHLGGLVLPLHQAVRIERRGDELVVLGPRFRLAWVPEARWLDQADTPAAEPVLDVGSDRLTLTSDIDRFVKVLRTYGTRDDLVEAPMVMKRVGR